METIAITIIFICYALDHIYAFHITSFTTRPELSRLSISKSTQVVDITTRSSLPQKLLLDQIDKITKLYSELETNNILQNINTKHEQDVHYAKSSPLPFETSNNDDDQLHRNVVEYESLYYDATKRSSISIQTKKNTPLLSIDEIQLLTKACESYWNRQDDDVSSEKSRFTYQRKGNSEAHLSDVVSYTQQHCNPASDVSHLVNELLLNRVYPWIRDAYLSKEEYQRDVNDFEFYVYDSLFIRYNATEANSEAGGSGSVTGAGQPLHRDLGYVSVNIMLNSQENFEGGGTFFEDQLIPLMQSSTNDQFACEEVQPLKPLGIGHAVAHYSSKRHAGAGTSAGVRDILVIFLATNYKQQSNEMSMAPSWELNARLKAAARSYCSDTCYDNIEEQLLCRIRHHRLAIDQIMTDGEAWHYLGMAVMDYYDFMLQQQPRPEYSDDVLDLAISCLNEAITHTPCDGRLYNNLGIALERCLSKCQARMLEELHNNISSAYQKSIMIHSKCKQVGCDVRADYESTCLNYGLYLSKLDEFVAAIDVLSKIVPINTADDTVVNETDDELDDVAWARQRVIRDATSLLSFCKRQV